MTRMIVLFLIFTSFVGGGLLLAEESFLSRKVKKNRLSSKVKQNLQLSALGTNDSSHIVQKQDQKRRAPASARVIDPDSGAKVYLYGACRAPYGVIYGPKDPEYSACMNEEAPFDGKGPFRSKAMGIGFHFN